MQLQGAVFRWRPLYVVPWNTGLDDSIRQFGGQSEFQRRPWSRRLGHLGGGRISGRSAGIRRGTLLLQRLFLLDLCLADGILSSRNGLGDRYPPASASAAGDFSGAGPVPVAGAGVEGPLPSPSCPQAAMTIQALSKATAHIAAAQGTVLFLLRVMLRLLGFGFRKGRCFKRLEHAGQGVQFRLRLGGRTRIDGQQFGQRRLRRICLGPDGFLRSRFSPRVQQSFG